LDEYEQLIAKSVVLEQDRHGIKVIKTADGRFVKFFRQKRFFSSALFKPYAYRFVEHAKALKRLGFNTVEVENVYYCKSVKRSLVFYDPLPGHTLRDALKSQDTSDDIMEMFSAFYAELHNQGVYFRSIHLSNVIISDTMDTLGLIDIADMKIYSKGLSKDMRMRNFRHLTRYAVDQESIKKFGVVRFMDIYFEASQLPESYKNDLLAGMQQQMSEGGKV
jgi:tRNA A-37 threonylcarbamoyl transferase component Bud32